MFIPDLPARISFVWWERSLDDASPVFTERDGCVVTLVAVWPVGVCGDLDVARLGDVQVMAWAMTDEVFANLEARHRRYPLDSGSVYRAMLSDRPEAAVVRARIEDALRGHARAA